MQRKPRSEFRRLSPARGPLMRGVSGCDGCGGLWFIAMVKSQTRQQVLSDLLAGSCPRLLSVHLPTHQEYVPRPPANVCTVHIKHLRSVQESVAVLVSPFRRLVVEVNYLEAEVRECMQLTRF